MNALLEKKIAPQIPATKELHCSGVDLHQPVGFLIKDAKLDMVGPEFYKPGFFPSYSFRKLSTDVALVSFGADVLQEEVEAGLDNNQLRPAELKEILAIAQPSAFPNEQVNGGPILALGSMAHGPQGYCVPGLHWTKELGRIAMAYACHGKWSRICRFAAVRL